jgi:arylsulfatase A-like enzyme/thioredoxin-like negative regulator of GroEL
MFRRRAFSTLILLALACRHEQRVQQQPRLNILLVTLDTTRADAIGAATPTLTALTKRGVSFRQAYCAVPQTLPSHTSMLTGLYPAGHGIHENARHLAGTQPVVAEKLRAAGYRTAAFVSAFALAKRFGLGRGFDVYDEDFGANHPERNAQETTDRALAYLAQPSNQPLFLWVHYYDPHYPYTPPEPWRTRYAKNPYLGEVGFMDSQLARLVAAFEKRGPAVMIFAGDHGEGLGEHGEQQHGNLLYQATMHVPLLIVDPSGAKGETNEPVSTRRIFHTILDFAGIDATNSLRKSNENVIAAEAMKPFLDYGWQPQVMAMEGTRKAILAGSLEIYDVVADPGEMHNLAPQTGPTRDQRSTLRDYPVPSLQAAAAAVPQNDEERRKLASLGYVSADVKPVVRKDAPRPADMAPLFGLIDEAARLFVNEQYAQSIPLLKKILAADPHNLDAALRLATALSTLGRNAEAEAAYQQAQVIAPDSPDVRTYLALHYARTKEFAKAEPLLERVVQENPDRVPPLEALAVIRERQRRIPEAVQLREKIYALRTPSSAELAHLGEMQMAIGDTSGAIASFERAPGHDLELGVLYLAARRFEDARAALDRVPPSHPAYPMALFKRAQVAVLLHEPDAPARIAAARAHANAETRVLIESERLFK